MGRLNGRLVRLEMTATARLGPDACRTCGLRHVRPLTLAIVRGVLGVAGSSETPVPAAPLCLCVPCCEDPADRWFARLSRGLPDG